MTKQFPRTKGLKKKRITTPKHRRIINTITNIGKSLFKRKYPKKNVRFGRRMRSLAVREKANDLKSKVKL